MAPHSLLVRGMPNAMALCKLNRAIPPFPAGEMTRGALGSFLLQALGLEQALEGLSVLAAKLARADGSRARVTTLLDTHPHVNRRGGLRWGPDVDVVADTDARLATGSTTSQTHTGSLPVVAESGLRGEIVFDHVSFAYPSRPNAAVLKDVSLRLEPGKVLALAGPSGSGTRYNFLMRMITHFYRTGKSTVASLIMGFYEPSHAHSRPHTPVSPPGANSGSSAEANSAMGWGGAGGGGGITVDGRPLTAVDKHWLRSHVAYVPQDTAPFNATIRENIAYGAPGATEEQVGGRAR
jgi:ABC-type multidrug transport system fused ATPase/permease subunit